MKRREVQEKTSTNLFCVLKPAQEYGILVKAYPRASSLTFLSPSSLQFSLLFPFNHVHHFH